MLITPYSSILGATQVASDYPSVKHFFKCDEAAGASGSSIYDSFGGVSQTTTAVITKPDAYSIDTTTSSASVLTGTITPIGTKITMIFAVGTWSIASGWAFGDGSGYNTASTSRITAAVSGTGGGISDATNTLSPTALALGAGTFGIGGIVDFTGNYRLFGTDSTGASWVLPAGSAVSTATPATLASGISSTGLKLLVPSGHTKQYGFMMCQFATMPSDAFLQAMSIWQTKNWLVGNKAVYPGLKGLAAG